jgi:hypothetical protein
VRLGEVLLVGGQRTEARSWFESALRTNPRSVESALLAGYLDREGRSGQPPARLVERVREAAKTEAPVRGVLGEGDRRVAHPAEPAPSAVAAPPLDSPLGRLLFEAPVLALRAAAAERPPLAADEVLQAWQRVDDMLRTYEERAREAAGSPEPTPSATSARRSSERPLVP